jgi:hypothetical protein
MEALCFERGVPFLVVQDRPTLYLGVLAGISQDIAPDV